MFPGYALNYYEQQQIQKTTKMAGVAKSTMINLVPLIDDTINLSICSEDRVLEFDNYFPNDDPFEADVSLVLPEQLIK
jgi:hypothetical protein